MCAAEREVIAKTRRMSAEAIYTYVVSLVCLVEAMQDLAYPIESCKLTCCYVLCLHSEASIFDAQPSNVKMWSASLSPMSWLHTQRPLLAKSAASFAPTRMWSHRAVNWTMRTTYSVLQCPLPSRLALAAYHLLASIASAAGL